MRPILTLTEKIGSGNDRDCWRHPENPTWCVKVARPDQLRPQNEIEFHYARYLTRHGVSGPHVPRVHGWARTDRGPGLVVDLIQLSDGTPAPTLGAALDSGLITSRQALSLVHEAFGWLIQNKVVLSDFNITNMLVCDAPDHRWRLVFIDGLGARHFDIHYWINRTLGFKARKKAREFQHHTLRFVQRHARSVRAGSTGIGADAGT